MFSSNADTHSERRKRMKFDYQEKNNFYLPNFRNREKDASEVVDFSDAFALTNLLEDLDGGKYGSVTKEYEKIHAQRKEVMNFLSALRLPLDDGCSNPEPKFSQGGLNSHSDPSTCQTHVKSDWHANGFISHKVVDLDADVIVVPSDHANKHVQHLCRKSAEVAPDHSVPLSMIKTKVSDVNAGTSDLPGKKDWEVNTSIIILESDEEGDYPVGKKFPTKSECQVCKFEERLDSHLSICKRQAKISAQDNHFIQPISYDQQYAKVHSYVAVEADWQPSIQYEKVILNNVSEHIPNQDAMGEQQVQENNNESRRRKREGETLDRGANTDKESDIYPSLVSSMEVREPSLSIEDRDDDDPETQSSDLEDIWKDMSLAMECSRSTATSDGSVALQKEEECSHSYVLEDDLGLVCRVCGVIEKSIETIFDNQWIKGTRSIRTYVSGSRNPELLDEAIEYSGPKISEDNVVTAETFVHPRHMKQMKPHQLEGFNFLVKNLIADKPGGCILAHAPGSGKTFMLISFLQSFFARYPCARPLVVLPKGILSTWKREFQRWQVEDIPLYDFYSSKADNRYQQLDVLKSWEEKKSILFLGYAQFATIVCGSDTSKVALACQERLLKVPSLLILDEGHTPRNEDTNVLKSLAKVQTPRKVVLSGTLFQNHVSEVFNILNLVRPKFLKKESSRVVVKRVLSRVHISGGSRIPIRGSVNKQFYGLVEETLQNDDNYKRKVTVIQDLRELTQNIIHYYKGDFLEELPGLVDFTVLLNLSDKQKEIIQRLGKLKRKYVGKFKKTSVWNAVYIHPYLKDIAESPVGDRANIFNDDKNDGILDSLDVRDGVKTKFFFNILSMTEAAGEKLLAFSQYLLPMKFLERLIVRMKGWRVGKEIFTITGDSSPEDRECSVDQFNNSPHAKVLFGSIKACGEGISLVGASRVLILDVHLNPSVTRQAIGRAFRPGQEKKVYTYRMVAADSLEEDDYKISFRKELISKMWFEWNEYGHGDFELEKIDAADCQDMFLESPILAEDINILYRR